MFVLLVILGTMSGYRGYRGLSGFMLGHQGHLAERLGLRRASLPSYSTIRRLLMETDFNAIADALNQWAQQAGLIKGGNHCAVDGKGLKNTLTDAFEATQNFVNVVSVFQLGQGLAVGQTAFENGQQSEIQAVYELLERLQLTGVTVSLNALHAQKNG